VIESNIAALVARAFPSSASHSVTTMPGGASTRQYFRVEVEKGKPCVAMFVPEGAKPEEVDKTAAGARWPFLEVRDLLAARGVDVPAILAEDTTAGWLLIEDLGDDTLANYLLRNASKKATLYTRAVTDLANAQHKLSDLPKDSVVARRAFDFDLLRWEIEHFREWGLEARGIPMAADDAREFARVADAIAHRICGFAQGFVHRDYQSRNLMVREDHNSFSLCWIDFQDALLGPRAYDLVALLGDSYQTFDRPFIEARLDEYAAALGLDKKAREALGIEFDVITVQRKLKDAGRFVFIDRKKNNPSFLKYVEPTILKVRAALERLEHESEFRVLQGVLKRTLPTAFA
jgi:N-acetylmuramate 1-kinase